MIEIGQVNRDAFRRWRSCRWSGDFVKFNVKPYGDKGHKQIRQRGYCVQKSMDVDFGTDCVILGTCWQGRRGASQKKTELQKIRIRKGAARAKKRRAERIAFQAKSKGIDEY